MKTLGESENNKRNNELVSSDSLSQEVYYES
jgi:hypothetical protein